jgi:sugar O-acyltransferase (sialic acid O-acetyltransferase NeuD family)
MKKVIIIGAGGFGREILDTIYHINQISQTYEVIGFIDNKIAKGNLVNGIPILGDDNNLKFYQDASLIIGIGDPNARKRYFELYKDRFDFPVIIHPTAIISNYALIGSGSIIQAFCIVAANSIIGNCVALNARSGVGHDAKIGDYTSIQSFCDVTGNNSVGELCFFGTGVKLIPGLVIASESYLCAGAVIFKDIVIKSKVLGNPGKIIHQ